MMNRVVQNALRSGGWCDEVVWRAIGALPYVLFRTCYRTYDCPEHCRITHRE